MSIRENVSLKLMNTFRVDVDSRYFYEIRSIEDLMGLDSCPGPHLFLGEGSNILFTQNYSGTVILSLLKGIEVLSEDNESVHIRVMGGENWHEFVLQMNACGYYGLEYLALIPGTVGAAPVQNIGAYGVEVGQYIRRVNVFDCDAREFKSFDVDNCDFSYRDSLFKREKMRYFIVSVEFELSKKAAVLLTYRALLDYFKSIDKRLETIEMDDVLNAVIAVRSSKLPDPKEIGNAGSFFKNPVVKEVVAIKLKSEIESLVMYPYADGLVKLAAGQLIELAGFKGVYENGVGMYEKQALVLVNLGEATGMDLMNHAEKVRRGVSDRFGIVLEAEPLIL